MILVFLGFSLFRRTLPHWTAPAYTGLIPLAAVFLYQIQKQDIKKLIPSPVLVSLALLFLILSLGIGQINHGLFDVESSVEASKKGADDPSLDMYGYGQIAVAFKEIHERDIKDGSMLESSILIGDNWFPLANLDFYVASPLGMKSYGLGQLDRIHKYAWINQIHGGFNLGMDAYYITTSRDYRHPNENFAEYFERIESADTIAIWRGGKVAKNAFVFRLKNMEKLPADLL